MKILFADNESFVPEAGFGCLPDSCLLRNNEHFYIPNFSADIEAHACIILKITKLGKYFAPEFAHRYYSGISIGIDFRATASTQYSDNVCRGFDKSLAIGDFTTLHECTSDKAIFRYNDAAATFDMKPIISKIDTYCAKLSEFYTFKIGDLLVISMGKIADRVSIGDKMTAELPPLRTETLIQ